MAFVVKDSGERKQFDSGMVRDTSAGKTEYHRVFEGPMLERWAEHLTKGAAKYPDNPDGSANWTLAAGEAEYVRFRASACRHFFQLMRGDDDEDHAAAVFFNINGMMYVQEKMQTQAAVDFIMDESFDLPPVSEAEFEEATRDLDEILAFPDTRPELRQYASVVAAGLCDKLLGVRSPAAEFVAAEEARIQAESRVNSFDEMPEE